MKVANLASWTKHSSEGCFKVCTQRTDVPFLTVQEGLCFRNCLTKFAVYLPEFNRAMKDTNASFYREKYSQENGLAVDPWEKQGNRLRQKYAP